MWSPAPKRSKLWHMELFKICVENKQLVIFSFFFIINQYYMSKIWLQIKFIHHESVLYAYCLLYYKNFFKTSNRLLFSLLSYFSNVYSNQVKTCYFSNMKNACSTQSRDCFSVYSVTFCNMKNVCSKSFTSFDKKQKLLLETTQTIVNEVLEIKF